jgi:hypothetical protein
LTLVVHLLAASRLVSAALTTLQGVSPNVSFTPAEAWSLASDGTSCAEPCRYGGRADLVGRHFTQTPAAVAAVQFFGTGIRIIGARSRRGADFGVSVDSSAFEAGTSKNGGDKVTSLVLFTKQGLSDGQHTLVMVHAGQRDQAIDVDQFVIEQVDSCARPGTCQTLVETAQAFGRSFFASPSDSLRRCHVHGVTSRHR